MKCIEFSWEEIHLAVDGIAFDIKNRGIEIIRVTGIPRGGLVPAVMLSHLLKVPFMPYPCDKRYELGMNNFRNCLLVDDIYDSGVTLEKPMHKLFYRAALYVRWNKDTDKIDSYGATLEHNEWVIFPWELEYRD